MAKETIVDTNTQLVTTTFSTSCVGGKAELNLTFDFSNLTLEQVYELALRSAVIDFQRTIRPLTVSEAVEKYNNSTVTVGEKKKRVESISARALRKHTKGEELTKEETQALIEVLTSLQVKPESTDDEITITKD